MREDTDRGFAEFGGNEMTVGSTIDDPAALRVASPRGVNKLSGNVLQPDGTQHEKQLLILTLDEGAGCFDFQAQLPNRTDDKGMVRLARLSPNGFEVFVPIIQRQMPLPPPPSDGGDPTHGIPEGDFAALAQVYGFASTDENLWPRYPWWVIVQRMDERDEYKTFPKAPVTPPAPTGDRFTPAQRMNFVAALADEFGFPPDTQSAQRYIVQGHSPSFRELHNDMLPRNNGAHNADAHHPDAPY
jgi:hypothetical protein